MKANPYRGSRARKKDVNRGRQAGALRTGRREQRFDSWLEVLDDIIRDGDKLHQATLADGPKFRYMLEQAERFLVHSGQMPLFRDDDRRASDPGSRCRLYLRHALLMALVHKKDNPTQGVLAAFFGIDQTTVSRYLQVMDRMLAETLPTAAKISEEIAGAATQEEFKRIVPGQGGGDIFLDGTHCPVQRPSEKTLRRMKYSGKKKRFTNNTNVYTNRGRGDNRDI